MRELLTSNAMVDTALVSPFPREDSHKASEGLGILAHLPLMPGKSDALELLLRLRQILGLNIRLSAVRKFSDQLSEGPQPHLQIEGKTIVE